MGEDRTGSSGVALLERPVESAELDETLVHVYCCDCYPNDDHVIAFCGTDLSGDDEETYTEDDVECVVCLDIEECPNDHRDFGYFSIIDEVTFF